MRTRTMILAATAALLSLALPAQAVPALDWAKETKPAACGVRGAPIVNVTQRVTGDIDSGFNGGWADDTYVRHIRLWETGPDEYCAVVSYAGRFVAIEGATSPGDGSSAVLAGDERGSMVGGYRASITGELLADPTWPARGTAGNFDYGCTDAGVCEARVDWVAQYFDGSYQFDFEFWGWVYRAGRDGTWVNASTGSSGNIG